MMVDYLSSQPDWAGYPVSAKTDQVQSSMKWHSGNARKYLEVLSDPRNHVCEIRH